VGVNGGTPGARGRKWLEHPDGTRTVLPSECHDVQVQTGDVLHFVTWGGGGWGDPLERDPALVELEVRRGLVTAEGARRYGVVVGDAGVDTAATGSLRAELRDGRPSSRCSTWARPWRRSWPTARPRPASRPRSARRGADALHHGFRAHVVRQACADRSPELHASNLADLDAKYADLDDLAEALAHL